MQRRIVVNTRDGKAYYVRDGELLRFDKSTNNYVRFLKLTTSKRWAKKFDESERDDFIMGIHASAEMKFYPQYNISFAS